MQRSLFALSLVLVSAVALVVQALLHSALAAWIGFAVVFVLAFGRLVGFVPGGDGGLGDGDRGDRNSGCCG
jgi:hypothetical protein